MATRTDSMTGLAVGDAREPVITRGLIVGVGVSAVGIAAAWGLPLTTTQREAVLYAIGVLAAPLAAWWARRHVNSPASTAKALGQSPAA